MKILFKQHLAKPLLAFAITLATITAFAAPPNAEMGFGVGTTNGATTLSWVIVSARSANNGAPAVNFINATSDKAASVVQFYKVLAQVQANFTNATVTLPITTTNGSGVNWSSGTIVIRHLGDDTYEKRTLTTVTAATNIVVTVAPITAVAPGDVIYFVSTTGAAKIPCGNATLTLSAAAPIYVGQAGKPLLMEIDSTASGTFNAAGGTYLNPFVTPKLGVN